MPRAYEHIRDSYLKAGKPEKTAKKLAAMTYIAKGKGGSRSSRAKSLHSDGGSNTGMLSVGRHVASHYGSKRGKK